MVLQDTSQHSPPGWDHFATQHTNWEWNGKHTYLLKRYEQFDCNSHSYYCIKQNHTSHGIRWYVIQSDHHPIQQIIPKWTSHFQMKYKIWNWERSFRLNPWTLSWFIQCIIQFQISEIMWRFIHSTQWMTIHLIIHIHSCCGDDAYRMHQIGYDPFQIVSSL